MDLNVVVLCGKIAAQPEIRTHENGATMLRLLVTTRVQEPRRRVDVIPVVCWDPPAHQLEPGYFVPGEQVWVAGQVQRRFWASETGRVSSLEIVAHHIEIKVEETVDA